MTRGCNFVEKEQSMLASSILSSLDVRQTVAVATVFPKFRAKPV
jgi:hypothetical protein